MTASGRAARLALAAGAATTSVLIGAVAAHAGSSDETTDRAQEATAGSPSQTHEPPIPLPDDGDEVALLGIGAVGGLLVTHGTLTARRSRRSDDS